MALADHPIRVPAPPAFSRDMVTVGVTGTNGKTSTTLLVGAALGARGRPVAQVTTLGSFLDAQRLEVPPTYEGFIETMAHAHRRGGRYAAIETTSEALARGFAKAWPCRVGVLTNFTRDHLDAHRSAEHYLASKAQLFAQLPSDGVAVLNGCDPATRLLEEIIPSGVKILYYGASSRGVAWAPLDLTAAAIDVSWSGTRVALSVGRRWGEFPESMTLRHVGEIYAENALAALGAAVSLGVEPRLAVAALENAMSPPGRFEVVGTGPRAVVDYAHTPDALARTLSTARALCQGTLFLVFGAGGDRDREKRAHMGAVAHIADKVVLTSDNPRSEDPADIVSHIRQGIGVDTDVEVVLDRTAAIERALSLASAADVVVIAGRGHERTQTTGGSERELVDREVVEDALALIG